LARANASFFYRDMDGRRDFARSASEVPEVTRPEPLSSRWWGLDWARLLPWRCGGLTVRHGDLQAAMPFIREHYAPIFGGPDPRFLPDPMCDRKERFYREADVLLVEDAGAAVGIQIAHPTDWSTYYVRTLALLPDYRGQGVLEDLTERMAEALAAVGVERIEGELAPNNGACLIAQTRLGYVVTGTQTTDRWGTMVRLTKFLREDAAGVFHRQFCGGAWPRPGHGSPRARGRMS
jgi:ribosomal protein S18 acetylase RimI-like enzyme